MDGWRSGPLEFRAGRLSRCGVDISLPAKAVDLLSVLIAARGAVVRKGDAIELLWPFRQMDEANLYVQFSALRRALGPQGGWIVSVPRIGYRFAGPIEFLNPELASAPTLRRRASVAVMPFDAADGDRDHAHFAAGLSDEVTGLLASVAWLFVIARASSAAAAARATDLRAAGRLLGARWLVQGSAWRRGGGVRVVVALVDATLGTEVWRDRFEARDAELFALQDHLAARIVEALEPELARAESALTMGLPTESLDAYDLCLRARVLTFERTQAAFAAAVENLERALDIDRDYPYAAVLLAWCRQSQMLQGWRDATARRPISFRVSAPAPRMRRRAIPLF